MGRWQQREVDVALDLQANCPSFPVIPVLTAGLRASARVSSSAHLGGPAKSGTRSSDRNSGQSDPGRTTRLGPPKSGGLCLVTLFRGNGYVNDKLFGGDWHVGHGVMCQVQGLGLNG